MGERLVEFIGPDRIAQEVGRLADQISRDYAGRSPLLVGVLKGAFVFIADLARQLTIPVSIDFIRAASYGATTETSGVVAIRADVGQAITGKDVIVIEDVIDTGLTSDFLSRHLKAKGPASLAFCSLLDKPSRRRVPFEPDYVGFTIEDRFVVGYGLDYDERHRERAGVYVLERS